VVKGGGRRKGEEMTQTLYIHMNLKNNSSNNNSNNSKNNRRRRRRRKIILLNGLDSSCE
jgi:hypothetical protein